MPSRKLYSVTALAAILAALATTTSAHAISAPSAAFVEQALCVHSGSHYTHVRVKHRQPEYHLFGHWYWRTWKTWSNGEGSWNGTVGNDYGGGLSFMVGTWNRAGAPYASSTSDIAATPPSEQIRRAWIITGGGRSWHEWPTTARACGYL